MTAKRDGQCSECEGEIVTGSRMVFDVTNHKAYCRQCGEMMLGPEEER
jgi:ribosomal protein S27E